MSDAGDLMTLVRVTVSLLVVLGTVVLAARLARRMQGRGATRGLRVLHRTALSREASLAVVSVGERALLLGVTAHQVSLLSDLGPADLATIGETEPRPRAARGAGRRLDVAASEPADLDAAATRLGGSGDVVRPRVGSGSVLSPATWGQAVEALRDLTARKR